MSKEKDPTKYVLFAFLSAVAVGVSVYMLLSAIQEYLKWIALGVLAVGAVVLLSFLYRIVDENVLKRWDERKHRRAEHKSMLKMREHETKIKEHEVRQSEYIALAYQQLAMSDTANFRLEAMPDMLKLDVIRTVVQPAPTTVSPETDPMLSAGQQQKQLAAPPISAPDPVDLVDIMRPAGKKVTIAFSSLGPVLVDLSRGEHLWLGGPTGKGKTTELRFLLAQIAPLAETYLLSPHYAPVKALSNGTLQDWRPIQSYLADYPARTATELERRLKWALVEMDRRYLAEEHGDYSWRFTPIYIAIDEWPEIVARYPGASDDIGAILRRGRHVGVCIINTSQSALVKVNGGSSSDRNQYGVVVNFGLSTTEANAMRANIVNVPSTDLGNQGLVICRAGDVEPTLARVPWVSNAGLYAWMFTPDEPISDSPVNVSGSNSRPQRAYAGNPEPVEPRPASTVQDDLRNTPAYRRFETLKRAGKTNKKEIILSVWGERAGASAGYQKASALYEKFQELYNEQIVDAEAITIQEEM